MGRPAEGWWGAALLAAVLCASAGCDPSKQPVGPESRPAASRATGSPAAPASQPVGLPVDVLGGAPLTPPERQKWFSSWFHDAGKVDEGAVITRFFPFRNPTGQTRRLLSLRKDCACARTAVHFAGRVIEAVSPLYPPLEVPPGAEGKIEVVLDTTAIDGVKAARVTVQTDDPEARWVQVGVQAESLLYFWAEPRQVALGEMGAADSRSFRVLLRSRRARTWSIPRHDAPPGYALAYTRVRDGESDAWQVECRVGPGLGPGDHSATLVFHTDFENRKLSLPVSLSVRPPWEVDPPGLINFGSLSRGRAGRVDLVVRNLTRQRRLKLIGLRLLETDRPLEHFRLEPRESSPGFRFDVAFHVLAGLPSGPFKGVLLVRTDDPDLPEVRVPFIGFVK